MAVMWNNKGLTKEQIIAAEPLVRTIEKYDRQIAAEKFSGNDLNEPFEKAKLRKDRIANIETKKKAVTKDLEAILDAKNVFDDKVTEAIDLIIDIGNMSKKYGFKLNSEQVEVLNSGLN